MRKLALICGGFSAGIFLAQYLLPEPWLLPLAALFLALELPAAVLPAGLRRRAALCFAGLALALMWNWAYCRHFRDPMTDLAGSRQSLVMTLTEYPEETAFGAKAEVRAEGLPGKLTYYGDAELLNLRPGWQVRDEVTLQDAARIRDSDVTVFTSKGIFLLAYGKGTPAYQAGNPASPRWWPARLAHRLQKQMQSVFPEDTAGFFAALLTGSREALSVQADTDLSEAGIYHILAVSGMHCAYLLAMVRVSHRPAPPAPDGGNRGSGAGVLRAADRGFALGGAGVHHADSPDRLHRCFAGRAIRPPPWRRHWR